ncbi:MAG: shikimate kinase [Oscillospiraceae bacterium]|nr:shikimate kinase [Oscillospiraceae bacterium]
MLRCGLLGKKLGHSYSPAIHSRLADYRYELFEKSEEELEAFLQSGCFDGLNVTIPYKKAVLPYCDEISDTVRAIGSVNTIVRRADGTLYGDNTDAAGFSYMIRESGITVDGAKALVLGSGGASLTVCHVLRQLGAKSVTVISRSGKDNYENLHCHADADIIVNTTPVGMYPNNGQAPLSLKAFPKCRGVLDVVYNPARTALCLEAEALGIPCAGGLSMLVAQAKRSAEQFIGAPIADEKVDAIRKELAASMQNIVLIGMPGSGKSSIGAALSVMLGRPLIDADEAFTQRAGMPPSEYLPRYGEPAFRDLECEVLAELGKRSGCILATGGGCILREENYASLHQNGQIFWIKRELANLPRDGRPLSQGADLAAMYETRKPRYHRFADFVIENSSSIEAAAKQIADAL